MTMRKAVFSMISIITMLFALAGTADAYWSDPRYRGPFTGPAGPSDPVGLQNCEATRVLWDTSYPDFDVAPCCSYYPSGAPLPGGKRGGPGYYFIYRVDLR